MNNDYTRNEKLKSTFNVVAKNFESVGPNYFTYFGHQLVERSGIGKGQKVLDVACGRGASLFKTIEKIGTSGHAVGIDFSNEMIKNIENHFQKKSMKNLKLYQMDAENIDLPLNHFDCVLCGLSIHFFSNPLLAVDEMYKVLKANGLIGISTWSIKKSSDKKGVLGRAYDRVFESKDNVAHKNKTCKPDYTSKEGLANILSDAGFTSIEIQEETKIFYYKNKDEWWKEQNNNATRGFFERIKSYGPSLFNEFKSAAYEEIEEDIVEEGIKFEASVLYAYAVK
jgi:ubiquinone/menaquinone biosynthesis C-methylase UbiE